MFSLTYNSLFYTIAEVKALTIDAFPQGEEGYCESHIINFPIQQSQASLSLTIVNETFCSQAYKAYNCQLHSGETFTQP